MLYHFFSSLVLHANFREPANGSGSWKTGKNLQLQYSHGQKASERQRTTRTYANLSPSPHLSGYAHGLPTSSKSASELMLEGRNSTNFSGEQIPL